MAVSRARLKRRVRGCLGPERAEADGRYTSGTAQPRITLVDSRITLVNSRMHMIHLRTMNNVLNLLVRGGGPPSPRTLDTKLEWFYVSP